MGISMRFTGFFGFQKVLKSALPVRFLRNQLHIQNPTHLFVLPRKFGAIWSTFIFCLKWAFLCILLAFLDFKKWLNRHFLSDIYETNCILCTPLTYSYFLESLERFGALLFSS